MLRGSAESREHDLWNEFLVSSQFRAYRILGLDKLKFGLSVPQLLCGSLN